MADTESEEKKQGAQVSAQELYELKQKAVEYYTKNGVPVKMEEILNSMFYDNPDDVYGHVSNFFEKYSKTPVISKVKVREVFDSRGEPTLQVDILGIVKNNEQLLSSMTSATHNSGLPDGAAAAEKELDDAERKESMTKAMEEITGPLSQRLADLDPTQQAYIDNILSRRLTELREEEEAAAAAAKAAAEAAEEAEAASSAAQAKSPRGAGSPEKDKKDKGDKKSGGKNSAKDKGGKKGAPVVAAPPEKTALHQKGSSCACILSMAVCSAGAMLSRRPLYAHISSLAQLQAPYHMPLPMVTVLQSGKAFPGKQNAIKEYMVVPSPNMPLHQSIKHIMAIYQQVAKMVSTKGGVVSRFTNELGALSPSLEKQEQGLDLLKEAVTAVGLTPGEDIFFALDCPASEVIDLEKGKYELCAGQLKSYDDTVEIYASLVETYPIIALIDPIRRLEIDQWGKLAERISEHCFLATKRGYGPPPLMKDEEMDPHFPTSGVVLNFETGTTVSDILACRNKMRNLNNAVILSANIGEAPDSTLTDLAVGAGVQFLKLGAPVRGERVAKLNRLVQIEEELEAAGTLAQEEAFAFPKLTLPPPPPPPADGAEEPQTTPKKDGKKK